MLSRPKTNWNFLFLKLKIEIKDNKADPKNKPRYKYSSLANTRISSLFVHKCNTNIKPAETPADNKR